MYLHVACTIIPPKDSNIVVDIARTSTSLGKTKSGSKVDTYHRYFLSDGGYLHGLKSPANYQQAEEVQIYETCSHNLLHSERASLFNHSLVGG